MLVENLEFVSPDRVGCWLARAKRKTFRVVSSTPLPMPAVPMTPPLADSGDPHAGHHNCLSRAMGACKNDEAAWAKGGLRKKK
ncbi:hypothetical protein E4U59_003434 [Claviceps monticola]|nr:hypothetical protein E4U59_003434 [Claviceps monticola]